MTQRLFFFFLFSSLFLFTFPQLSVISAQSPGSPNLQIEQGRFETVYSWSTQKCPQDRDIPDAPARAFVDDGGNVQLIAADEKARRNIGPNLDDLEHRCEVLFDSHRNPTPRMYDDVEWLASPYTLDGKNIYSLVHTEYQGWEHNNCNRTGSSRYLDCWWNSINLANSVDSGRTYTHLTAPNHNIANSPVDYNPNNTEGPIGYLEPSNIIFKDGYYYALLKAYNPPDSWRYCLMRTNDLANPTGWYFWDGNGFEISTRGGRCVAITGDTPHYSLSYNNYLEKFMAVECYPEWGCTYSLSDDLIHWSNRKTLLESKEYNLLAYGSLLSPGDQTRNFEKTNRSPWLYFASCASGPPYNGNTCPGENLDRNISRLRLRFTKPGDENRYELLDLQMNEKKGTKTLDSSFYSNNGLLSNGVTFMEENENFLHFNGSGKVKVIHRASLNASSYLTIEAKIRTSVSPPEGVFHTIIRKENSLGLRNYGLYITNGGVLYFSLTQSGGLSGSIGTKKINDGQWHKIRLTYDDTTGKATYYVDDQLDVERRHNARLQDGINSSSVFIGDGGFIGDIDYLVVYNYVEDSPLVPTSTTPLISSQCICPSGLNKLQTGDANCDGINNILDFGIWSNEFIDFANHRLERSLWRTDFNCDQVIDLRDFEIWRNQWTGD